MLIPEKKIHDNHLKIDFSQPWVVVNPRADDPLPSSSTIESLPISSAFSSDKQKEIPLRLFLDKVEQRRQECELIFGNREGSDLTEEKSFGLGASKTAAGCYQIPIDSTAKMGLNGWVEFVITYDNKFILNNIDSETITEEKQHQSLDFNHYMIAGGKFLKAAGRIKIETYRRIFISPFSKYFQLGMDYTPIILFVLEEMGIFSSRVNLLIADEQGNNISCPETRPVNKANKYQICESMVVFYLKKNRFPLAKSIAEKKELDIEKEFSDFFLSIDDTILSSRNKKNIIGLIDNNLHLNLKMAVVDLLLALIREDFSNFFVNFTEKNINTYLFEIYENIELTESKFDTSIEEEVLKTINSNLLIISDLLQKDNLDDIVRGCNKFSSFTIDTNRQNAQSDLNANREKVSKKTISEKLSVIIKNIQSINLPPNEKYNNSNLKDIIINTICKILFQINKSILLKKNDDNDSLDDFDKINQYIQSIKDKYCIDLSFIKYERYNWLFYISKLKFEIADNLNKENEATNSVASETLCNIESKLKKFKAGSLPQRNMDEQAINSPFLKFYSKNPFQTCLLLLYDYNKSGSFERFLTGAWNRHYIEQVGNLLIKYEMYGYPDNLSIKDIYQILLYVEGESDFVDYKRKKGTLYLRLEFCINLERKRAIDSTRPESNDFAVNRTLSVQDPSQSVQPEPNDSVIKQQEPSTPSLSKSVKFVPSLPSNPVPTMSSAPISFRQSESMPLPNGSVPSAKTVSSPSSQEYVFGRGMYSKSPHGETKIVPPASASKSEDEKESSLHLSR